MSHNTLARASPATQLRHCQPLFIRPCVRWVGDFGRLVAATPTQARMAWTQAEIKSPDPIQLVWIGEKDGELENACARCSLPPSALRGWCRRSVGDVSVQPHLLILSTDPHEADGVEDAFVVFVASSPSGLTNPGEPDGVAWSDFVHAIRRGVRGARKRTSNSSPRNLLRKTQSQLFAVQCAALQQQRPADLAGFRQVPSPIRLAKPSSRADSIWTVCRSLLRNSLSHLDSQRRFEKCCCTLTSRKSVC